MDIPRTAPPPPGSWRQNVSSTSFDVSDLWVGPARDLGGLEANSSPQTGCFAPQAIPEPSFSLHDWVQGLHQQEVQWVNVTSTSTATGLPLMHDSSDQTPLFHSTVGLFWCSCPPPAAWGTRLPWLASHLLLVHQLTAETGNTCLLPCQVGGQKCPFVRTMSVNINHPQSPLTITESEGAF